MTIKLLLTLSITSLVLFSCASNDIDEELSGISNNDFKPAANVRYRAGRDYYSLKLMNSDVLERETIARVDKDTIGGEIDKREDFLFKAIAYCYENNFDKARSIFDSIYKKFFNNPSFWNHQGSCSFLEGNLSRANLFYLKAIDLAPKYTPAINNIGVIYQVKGDAQKAVAAFNKAISGNRTAKTPRFNIARIFLKNGLAAEARAKIWPLYKTNKQDDEVLGLIAISYLMQGQLSKSLQYFTKVTKTRLQTADFGLNYSVLQFLLGMKSDAEDTFESINKKSLGGNQEYYEEVKKFIGI